MMYCCTRLSEIGRHILPVGRSVLDERGLSTDWSGAGFSVKVKADRAVIGLGGYDSETPSYLRVYIGGRPAFKQAVSTGNEKIVIEDLFLHRNKFFIAGFEDLFLVNILTFFDSCFFIDDLLTGFSNRLFL